MSSFSATMEGMVYSSYFESWVRDDDDSAWTMSVTVVNSDGCTKIVRCKSKTGLESRR